jgi:TM2 domain-containing membrane protein YozV
MKLFFLIALFTFSFIFVKNLSAQNEFHSPKNVKLFADYLFCEKDYLRAAEEYQKLVGENMNDTVAYKIVLSYSSIRDLDKAKESLKLINKNSIFYGQSILESLKIKFLLDEKFNIENDESLNATLKDEKIHSAFLKLWFTTNLRYPLPGVADSKENFLAVFEEPLRGEAKELFYLRYYPNYKNPVTAGILSSIIPGAGKFYVDEIGDGVMALLTTGIFAFLSYDNFRAEHNFRGWLFAGISSLFYAGNIYGSVAAAQIFNSRVDYEFGVKLNSFLDDNNFFIPQINFCR